MLEKPDLEDGEIIACLQEAYGLVVPEIEFLPIGADQNTAVFRALAKDGTAYFTKLRSGDFNETSVWLPKLFSDQGISQVIAPLPNQDSRLWSDLEGFKVVLYPYIDGLNGYERDLTDHQWVELGSALQRIHSANVPARLPNRIRRETWSGKWREQAQFFLERLDRSGFTEPIAKNLASFMESKRSVVQDLIRRAETLARQLQAQNLPEVVCHADIHAGNVLIASNSSLYIVDWDDPILAPKERDLMYAGGAQFGSFRTPQQEEALFYQGYGPVEVNRAALAYYRSERIIEDIAVECEQIVFQTVSREDREQALEYLISNFSPEGTIEIAYAADSTGQYGLN